MVRGRKKKTARRSASTGVTDLSGLSLSALQKLRAQVDERIATVQVEEVARLKAEFEAKAARLGLSASEIVGNKRRRRAGRKGSRQAGRPSGKLFVNPADPSKTWSGRGRRPRWVNEFVDRGGDLDSLKA